MDGNSAAVIAAAVAAVPGVLAAIGTRRSNKKLKTSNGKTVAQYIEEIRAEQALVASALVSETQKNEQDRTVMREHIANDEKFQQRVEPILLAQGR